MSEKDPVAFELEYTTAVIPEVKGSKGVTPGATVPGASDEEDIDDFTTIGKGGKAMQFTSEGIFKNLQLVQEARGKKVCQSQQSLRSLH
jgi:translation initiation factor 3 subunit C